MLQYHCHSALRLPPLPPPDAPFPLACRLRSDRPPCPPHLRASAASLPWKRIPSDGLLGSPGLRNWSRSTVKTPARCSHRSDVLPTGEIAKTVIAKKVAQTVLSAALFFGLALCNRSGSAIAGTLISLPGATRAAAAASTRTDLFVSAWMGLMAGCLHTLTGPDHLAALAPLSIGRTRLESVAVGALWGCGHDAGQMMFGILFLLLKGKLHIEVLRTWGARVVGMTLLTIGVLGVKEAQAIPVLAAADGSSFSTMLPPSESMKGTKRKVGLATFATGIVHGLQPDALLMILPAIALPSRFAGAAFLIMFLFGTILAMSGYTAFIGSCSHALQKRIPRITEHLTWGSSLFAIFVGAAILVGEIFGLTIF